MMVAAIIAVPRMDTNGHKRSFDILPRIVDNSGIHASATALALSPANSRLALQREPIYFAI